MDSGRAYPIAAYPALQMTDSFIPQVLKLADLHWNVL